MATINHCGDLENLVLQMGFLPFFKNRISNFSIEEFTPEHLWFPDDEEGPWEWKGPVIRNWQCAYGKLFQKKAGFVSMEWFPDLVNYRRSVYNLTEESSESMNRIIYDMVAEHESLLSREIKALCGYRNKQIKKSANPFDSWDSRIVKELQGDTRPKKEGYETAITRLQMGTWLIVADFEYLYNKQGDRYGWGIARYITPEAVFGEETIRSASHRTPEESKQRLINHLTKLLPQATPKQILDIIG